MRPEDGDKAETSAKYKGARKPLTTFKGHLLHVRYVPPPTPQLIGLLTVAGAGGGEIQPDCCL